MAAGHLFHGRHQQLVMIDSQIGLLKNRSTFELIRGHLVMPGFNGNPQAMTLVFQLVHESRNPCRYGTEILIFQLLIFRGRMPHQSTTAQFQVRTGIIKGFIHQKILLLPAQRGYHTLHIFIEILANVHRGPVNHGQSL